MQAATQAVLSKVLMKRVTVLPRSSVQAEKERDSGPANQRVPRRIKERICHLLWKAQEEKVPLLQPVQQAEEQRHQQYATFCLPRSRPSVSAASCRWLSFLAVLCRQWLAAAAALLPVQLRSGTLVRGCKAAEKLQVAFLQKQTWGVPKPPCSQACGITKPAL